MSVWPMMCASLALRVAFLGRVVEGKRSHLFLSASHLHSSVVREALERVSPGSLTSMRKLLGHIDRDGGNKGDAPRCATCAVVGNAGTLKRAKLGREIDSHECVIRVNVAVTQHFERLVGKKSTVHVWAIPTLPGAVGDQGHVKIQQRELATFSKLAENVTVHFFSNADAVDRILDMVMEGLVPSAKLRAMHPYFVLDFCSKLIGSQCDNTRRPSTGLLAVGLALNMCDSPPNVYGFDANSMPFHYYDPPDDVCSATAGARIGGQGVHNFTYERETLSRWHDDGLLHLWQTEFTPEQNGSHCDMPRALKIAFPVPDIAGIYHVQPYVINGRLVYERGDSRGEDFYKVLYFSRCAIGDQLGAYIIAPQQQLVRTQKETPGLDYSCNAGLYSTDFRPEAPAFSSWMVMDGPSSFRSTAGYFFIKKVVDPRLYK